MCRCSSALKRVMGDTSLFSCARRRLASSPYQMSKLEIDDWTNRTHNSQDATKNGTNEASMKNTRIGLLAAAALWALPTTALAQEADEAAEKGGEAIAFIGVDEPIRAAELQQIEALEQVKQAKSLQF